MAETVFILGAGASRQGGAPLMADFLDTAELLWRRGEVQDASQDFERVFTTLAKLHIVHSKSELDLTNVESAFAALEMARTLKRLPGASEGDISDAISALKKVIAKTIEVTLRLPTKERQVLPPVPYDGFVELINHLQHQAHPAQTVAVLTFNYDLAIDYALHWNNIQPDYGLEKCNRRGAVPLLKLHGSLNWGTCTKCGEVVSWDLPSFFKKYHWNHGPSLAPRVTLDIGSRLTNYMHCDAAIAPEPVLVPPTWNKGEYHSSLSKVWARAARELSEAENIFVCGYSLPETDSFFRYLYAIGTVGERPLKRFWVYDPDPSGTVKARFEAMIGPGARRRFEFRQQVFQVSIKQVRAEFPARG